ncbi:MAG: hypothetical protein AAFV53_38945 [Myxococcota bacterium]
MTRHVPSREHYLQVQVKRRLVGPQFPRWHGEGTPCPGCPADHASGGRCTGTRYAVRTSELHAPVTSHQEYLEIYGQPAPDDLCAGEWACDGDPSHSGLIGLDEVWESEDAFWEAADG